MEFQKYQHIERLGTEEVQDIELGKLLVFPKIDGTNGSVWLSDEGIVQAGSRNRHLTLDDDNQGFYAYIIEHDGIRKYLEQHPRHRLYGEWLVSHSFQNYRDDAWHKFYVFDIVMEYNDEEQGFEYIPYDNYQPQMEKYGIDYVVPICKMTNGSYDAFLKAIEKNTFLVKDDMGVGEGIVIKNYDYKNKYGRITWAKIVTNEFKEKNAKAMGIAELKAKKMSEEEIVDNYCTEAFIEKEYAKIVADRGGWQSKYIPELLGRVFSELIKEESWNFVKALKYPTINYKTLNSLVVSKIKQVKPEIFN